MAVTLVFDNIADPIRRKLSQRAGSRLSPFPQLFPRTHLGAGQVMWKKSRLQVL